VMEKLSIDMQVRISRQIRERSMGLIMGAMSPDGAAMLSAAFANNGKLPPGLGNATIAPPALQSSNSARADPRISPMSASPGPLVPAVKLN
jgi:hypothetical protein